MWAENFLRNRGSAFLERAPSILPQAGGGGGFIKTPPLGREEFEKGASPPREEWWERAG